jgi:hypothetical protein
MTSSEPPALNTLDYQAYLNAEGCVNPTFDQQIGVYAIFDQAKTLEYVGYSRNVLLSLRQHLIRQPERCHWVKVQPIERPDRAFLEAVQQAWLLSTSPTTPERLPVDAWVGPIKIPAHLTPAEQTALDQSPPDSLERQKLLKVAGRRLESEILQQLAQRGVREEFRFNPKLKETGLLDLK